MSHEWHTPRDLVRDLQRAVGGFDLDPASGCEPDPIADARYTKEDDGLIQPWYGTVFVNPPYGREENPAWTEKIRDEAEQDSTDLIVALLPANVGTTWWHDYVTDADLICLLNGRLSFGGVSQSARFASAIAVFGEDIPGELRATLADWGQLYEPNYALPIAGFQVGDVLELSLDDRSIAFPEGVDADATARVVSGRVSDGVVEVMAVQPGEDHETYFLIHAPLDDPTDIRCSVDHTHLGWRDVPLRDVQRRVESAGPSAIGYVC